ncbi:hypothetical protein MLD38_033736 [Melastoma candidum]|uniref:Uncharacterized protein n=1 Tax=Melastoma candidum TaxID=119954 RepID=A0ACB9M7E2_9MYRT|nr:hypothetical protein MLD38_033736 [Melastoma candidum]
MYQDLVTNARSYDCSGIGRNGGQITCFLFQTPCTNRDQYIFWDAFDPMEAVNVLMARKAFNGNPSITYQINIEQLANILESFDEINFLLSDKLSSLFDSSGFLLLCKSAFGATSELL